MNQNNKTGIMTNFKKIPIPNYTKASVITSEDTKYWKELGVRRH
jgi:hypothetical protein